MADTPFMKPEVPEAILDLMKMSIEQAKRAFETFAATSEKAWKSLDTSSQSACSGIKSLNEKIGDIMRSNPEANFALALKLAESKDPGDGAPERARAQADGRLRQAARGNSRPRHATDSRCRAAEERWLGFSLATIPSWG